MVSGFFTYPELSQQGPLIYISHLHPRDQGEHTCLITVEALTHTL